LGHPVYILHALVRCVRFQVCFMSVAVYSNNLVTFQFMKTVLWNLRNGLVSPGGCWQYFTVI